MKHLSSILTPSKLNQTLRSSAFALVASVVIGFQGNAFAQTVDESKYKPVRQEITVTSGSKIEVAELFWFGCSHCFALEPALKEWKKSAPENVEFKKVPALFSSSWEFHGQAYYTMQSLDVPEQAYDDFFSSIHVKRKGISNLPQLVSFLAAYEKTEQQVESAFNSFDVNNKMRAAKNITRQSGASGVPAIIVDGKYLTSQQLGGGTAEMFDVVNQLVGKAASER